MTPAVVCFAFAAELYLKCLLAIETGEARRGHKLHRELFSALSPKLQATLAQHYMSELGRDQAELVANVIAFENAFVEWRYEHEHTGLAVDTSALAAFGRALLRTILEQESTLMVDAELKDRILSVQVSTLVQMKIDPLVGGQISFTIHSK